MNKSELEKLVNQEIDWLRYYGYREDREKLTINSEIYDELNSIGYTKRRISLDRRCAPCIITSDEIICEGIDLDKLRSEYFPHDKNNNRFTPIEAYIIIYPENKKQIIERLK
jgi:hypothetical protein